MPILTTAIAMSGLASWAIAKEPTEPLVNETSTPAVTLRRQLTPDSDSRVLRVFTSELLGVTCTVETLVDIHVLDRSERSGARVEENILRARSTEAKGGEVITANYARPMDHIALSRTLQYRLSPQGAVSERTVSNLGAGSMSASDPCIDHMAPWDLLEPVLELPSHAISPGETWTSKSTWGTPAGPRTTYTLTYVGRDDTGGATVRLIGAGETPTRPGCNPTSRSDGVATFDVSAGRWSKIEIRSVHNACFSDGNPQDLTVTTLWRQVQTDEASLDL